MDRVSLMGLFEQSREIEDLALAPHERIAIMRLLICIIQRALRGPEDEEEREECLDRIIPESLAYLRQWQHAFQLLPENNEGAFLQLPGLEGKPCSGGIYKLHITAASGNNSTLFDHSGGTNRVACLEQLAIDLVTFQNFSPSGLIGKLKWKGENISETKGADASPCITKSAIHLFLVGRNLLETLSFNLIPLNQICPALKRQMGVPVWEKMPQSKLDEEAIYNATKTYLGRLVPISRAIRIIPDLQNCLIAQGLKYEILDKNEEVICWEGSMVIYNSKSKKGKFELKLLEAQIDRALWRDLSALLVSRFKRTNQVFDNESLPKIFDVWVGALVYDKKHTANLLGTMEEIFTQLTPEIRREAVLKSMQNLLSIADSGDRIMNKALMEYDDYVGKEEKKKDSEIMKVPRARNASRLYWESMVQMKTKYIDLAKRAINISDEAERPWLNHICHSARLAFNAMAPRQTSRQLQAWAKASQLLPTIKSLQKNGASKEEQGFN